MKKKRTPSIRNAKKVGLFNAEGKPLVICNIRKGLGKGLGKGYSNLVLSDVKIHSDSAKGRKQPQKSVMQKLPKGKKAQKVGDKVDLKYVEVSRLEGAFEEKDRVKRFMSFEDADKWLMEISKDAPKGGCYDKTNVKVVWQNGDAWAERFDIKHFSEPNPDNKVGVVLKNQLDYYAGNNQRGKEAIEKGWTKLSTQNEAKKMLKDLNLGDTQEDDRVNDVQIKEDKSKTLAKDIAYFTGSGQRFKWSPLYPNYTLSEGAKYVAEKGEAYWLMDIVASWQTRPKVRKEEFQVWKLKRTKGSEAIVTAEDGNGNKIATQKIPFTDFPLKGITLYFENDMIVLPNER